MSRRFDHAAYYPTFPEKIRDYERSPRWVARSARFRKTHPRCQACGRYGVDAHHITYDRAFTGREPDGDLRALCRTCHQAVHGLTRHPNRWPLRYATDQVIAYGVAGADKQPQRSLRWMKVLARLFLLFAALCVVLTYTGWVLH